MTEAEVIRTMREHLEGQFPKVCPACHRRFAALREYLLTTEHVGPAIWWSFPQFGPPCRNVSANRSSPRWSTACWHAMAGERWRPTRAIPRASLRFRRNGKKLPEVLETLLTPDVAKGRHVRLMFQDEARFGRMVRIRRCWAPAPHRPVVDNGYTNGRFNMFTERSARGKENWTGGSARSPEWEKQVRKRIAMPCRFT